MTDTERLDKLWGLMAGGSPFLCLYLTIDDGDTREIGCLIENGDTEIELAEAPDLRQAIDNIGGMK